MTKKMPLLVDQVFTDQEKYLIKTLCREEKAFLIDCIKYSKNTNDIMNWKNTSESLKGIIKKL